MKQEQSKRDRALHQKIVLKAKEKESDGYLHNTSLTF